MSDVLQNSSSSSIVTSVAVSYEVKAQVDRFMADYAAAIDNDRLELWPDFFIDDCIYKVIARSDYDKGRPVGFMYCDNRRMLLDRVASIRSVNVFHPHHYRHVLGPTRILGERAGALLAETSFIVARTSVADGTTMIFSAGRYVDAIAFPNATAKLESRIVVTDSDSIDMLLVLPI